MKVKDVMSTPPVVCRATASVAEAAAEMWRHDCGALPVVDDNEVAIGMITDRDIAIAVGTRTQPAGEIPVSSVISGHLTYVHPDDGLESVVESMERDRVRRVPVLDESSHVVGLVSINDLVLRAEKTAETALAPDHVLAAVREVSTHWRPATIEHVSEVSSAPRETKRSWRVDARAGDASARTTTRRRGHH